MTHKHSSVAHVTHATQHKPFVKPPRETFPAQTISMGKNMALTIEPIEVAFTLPHRFHERVLHELKEHHSRADILLSRRVGYLGSHQPVRYSLLAYRENAQTHQVTVHGAALTSNEAWTYKALIPLKDLGIGIAKILEHIAALPIHSAVPHGTSATGNKTNVTDTFCDTG